MTRSAGGFEARLAGGLEARFAGGFAVGFAGGFAEGFAARFAGGFAGGFATRFAGVFAGGFAGSLAESFADSLAIFIGRTSVFVLRYLGPRRFFCEALNLRVSSAERFSASTSFFRRARQSGLADIGTGLGTDSW
jgi:hypothetical protein